MTALALAVFLVASAGASGSHAPQQSAYAAHPGPQRVFARDSIWNSPLRPGTRVSGNSTLEVTSLRHDVATTGAWINTTKWSTPVYTVPANAPTVRVGLRQPAGIALSLREAFASVPIPKGARPSPDADGHMVILQPSRHRMWEFWQLRHQSGRWHASYGGEMLHVSASAGYFPTSPGWGATATGLPLIGGLMRISELRTGRINHALSMAVPNTKAGVFASPAQRTDGRTFGPTAIPEGTRFRLDPSLDISKLDLSPVMRSIVVAAQRYGMIVTDTGSNVALYAEDPAPKQSNPYSRGGGGLFGDRYPNQLMAEFPWSHLVVVAAPLHTR